VGGDEVNDAHEDEWWMTAMTLLLMALIGGAFLLGGWLL
jgi:hypothetical protein